MALGFFDAKKLWHYGEDDSFATFSARLNKLVDSIASAFDFAKIGDTGWTNLAVAGGSWTISAQPQYRKINNVVYVRGSLVKSSAIVAADPMTAALPAGFRPSTLTPISAVHGSGTPAAAGAQPTGIITAYPTAGGSTQLIFAGSFVADA